MSGLTGINCTQKCPFPTHGKRCQMICNCKKEQCEVFKGWSSHFDGIPF